MIVDFVETNLGQFDLIILTPTYFREVVNAFFRSLDRYLRNLIVSILYLVLATYVHCYHFCSRYQYFHHTLFCTLSCIF